MVKGRFMKPTSTIAFAGAPILPGRRLTACPPTRSQWGTDIFLTKLLPGDRPARLLTVGPWPEGADLSRRWEARAAPPALRGESGTSSPSTIFRTEAWPPV